MAEKGKSNVAPPSQPQQLVTTGGVGSATGDLAKRKRGRPRKIDGARNSMVPPVITVASPPVFSGVEKGKFVAGEFRPAVIDVYHGEDVIGKIMSLTQGSPGEVYVLSAIGTVANVVLRQPGSSSGVISYAGQFDIVSLSGSSTTSEVGAMRRRTGVFTVSLAAPTGQVIGGGVAGPLIAANTIQTVVASIMFDTQKYYAQKQQGEAHGSIHASGPHPTNGNRADEPAKQKPCLDINMVAPDE